MTFRILNLVLLCLTFFSCSNLFYQPTSYLYSDPKKLDLVYEEVRFKSNQDGVELVGWHFKAKAPSLNSKKKTKKNALILMFHGNAENITSHYYNLAWIMKEEGFEFIIFDYRGYGLSEGSPSQEGVYNDALAALSFGYEVFAKQHFNKFIVYGQSLGGAIALRALKDFEKKNKVNLLVMDSTFLSYQSIASAKLRSSWLTYIFSPLAYLLVSDRTSPKNMIQDLKIPTLVIHGMRDQVIPFSFGEEIYKNLNALGPNRKWFWAIEDGGHIDVFTSHSDKYQKAFLDLVAKKI